MVSVWQNGRINLQVDLRGDIGRSGIENERGGMKDKNIGSSFDSWLREEGIYEEVSAAALKRALVRQVAAAMERRPLKQKQ